MGLSIGLDLASGQSGSAYGFVNSEAEIYVGAMSVEPSNARKALIDTYIGALRAAGVWTKLDLLYLHAAHDEQAGKLNLKNPGDFTCANVGSPSFAVDRGFTGNGSNSALSTQWVPDDDGVNFIQDSASQWIWSLTNSQSSASDAGDTATNSAEINLRNASNQAIWRLNDATDSTLGSNTNSARFFGIIRPASTHRQIYINGLQAGASAIVDSAGVSDRAQWVCGANNTDFSTRQIAVSAWGDGTIIDTFAEDFYSATLAYLQGIGAA